MKIMKQKKPFMFRWVHHPYVNHQHWVGFGQYRSACGITIAGCGSWAPIDGDAIPKCKKCVEIERKELAHAEKR